MASHAQIYFAASPKVEARVILEATRKFFCLKSSFTCRFEADERPFLALNLGQIHQYAPDSSAILGWQRLVS